MLSLDKLSILRFDWSPETTTSIDVHWVSDLAYSPRPVEIHDLESLAAVLLHHNVCITHVSMHIACLVKGGELLDDIVMMGITRGKIHQTTIILPNHLHNNHVPSSW